jgi:hypothetical protein
MILRDWYGADDPTRGPMRRLGSVTERENFFYRRVPKEDLLRWIRESVEQLPRARPGRETIHQASNALNMLIELREREIDEWTASKRDRTGKRPETTNGKEQ